MTRCDIIPGFDTFKGYLQALRALSVISTMLLLCSIICNILALDCINQVLPNKKAWLARVGGGSSLIAGKTMQWSLKAEYILPTKWVAYERAME